MENNKHKEALAIIGFGLIGATIGILAMLSGVDKLDKLVTEKEKK